MSPISVFKPRNNPLWAGCITTPADVGRIYEYSCYSRPRPLPQAGADGVTLFGATARDRLASPYFDVPPHARRSERLGLQIEWPMPSTAHPVVVVQSEDWRELLRLEQEPEPPVWVSVPVEIDRAVKRARIVLILPRPIEYSLPISFVVVAL